LRGPEPLGCGPLGAEHTGEWPLGIAVDPLTHSLYVPNDGDNDVSVIDAAKCDATDTTGCQHGLFGA